jgi:hypothetical protein
MSYILGGKAGLPNKFIVMNVHTVFYENLTIGLPTATRTLKHVLPP